MNVRTANFVVKNASILMALISVVVNMVINLIHTAEFAMVKGFFI
jgi:hypothetical protein